VGSDRGVPLGTALARVGNPTRATSQTGSRRNLPASTKVLVLLGHVISDQHRGLQILDGRIEVERLVHVVAGRVVASLNPVLDEFPSIYLGIFCLQSLTHAQRGNALAHEGVVIGADE
jgi:hypothetical protein